MLIAVSNSDVSYHSAQFEVCFLLGFSYFPWKSEGMFLISTFLNCGRQLYACFPMKLYAMVSETLRYKPLLDRLVVKADPK